MKERSFDEMIAYFNRRAADMDISQDCKMELLGMVTALGYKHEKSAQQWIPCSERLPEADKEVLISYRYKEGESDTSHTYIDITTYGYMYFGGRMVNGEKYWRPPFEYFNTNYEVIAWMPLPKPYEERREDA